MVWFKFPYVIVFCWSMRMEIQTLVHHVAVECSDVQTADTFFRDVLGIPKVKSTLLSRELCQSIFNIDSPVQMETYDTGTMRVEVFITPEPVHPRFVHLGIAVESKAAFIMRCEQQGLAPFVVQKNGKQLLFVRDFSGNLFEIVGQ
jgi:catechol 2,3-dioxygenase-like lactoylglutathione lyase family enzyme